MSEVVRELLVILAADGATESLARVRSHAAVTQMLAPRLILVRVGSELASRIAAIEGVLAVHEDAPAALPQLTPAEHSFVSAWVLRQQPKSRTGDGRSWGEPHFQPPDMPPGRRSRQ